MKYLKGYFLERKHHPATYFRISESQKSSIIVMKILFVHMPYLLKRKDFFLKNSDTVTFISSFAIQILRSIDYIHVKVELTLREKCLNTGFFLVCIFWSEYRSQFECGKIRTRKNFVFGHFSRSVSYVELY